MRNPRVILAALVAVLAAIIVFATDGDGPGGPSPPRTITIAVDGVDKDTVRDDKVVLEPAEQQYVNTELDDARGDLVEPLNSGDTPEAPAAVNGDPLPLAAQEWPGCRTQFVRNQSSRGGVQPRIIVWHYTVSPDNGWPSADALTAMSNNPANGVSWHFSIGRASGVCAFNVPLSAKAWTEANANPFSVGIEVIALGNEGTYVTGAGQARLVEVTREIGARLGIPMQRGLVQNCQVVRPGIIRHVDLGACGGGHHDTDPFPDPIAQLLPLLQARTVTDRDRASCRKIHAYRDRPAVNRARGAERRQERRLRFVAGHGLKCTAGKPVRA